MKKRFFLGIEPKVDPAVSIIPMPLEATVSYGGGTALAPKAILDASHQVELYDEELEASPVDVGIEYQKDLLCKGSVKKILDMLEKRVLDVMSENRLPFIIGGEHSLTPAAVRGVFKYFPDLTVVQLDAHADLRQSYEGSEFSHASAMARVREFLPAVQVGIRSLSAEEASEIKKNSWPVFFAHRIHGCSDWMDKAISEIKTQFVYLTVDVDVFDCGILPETGTPEPGGLDWQQVTTFIRKLIQAKKVVGMDVVELAPVRSRHSSDFMIAKLIHKMIGYWARSQGKI